MGVALGWVAAALAAAGAGSPPDEAKPEITYRFRTVAVRGLAWREAGLKPVVQHNAVSVWTSADDFLDRLPGEAQAVAAGPVEVKGFAQAPVHVTTRKSHDFVTQVVWKGKGKAPKPVTESVREGLVATVVGRKIDQGVLAQLVIDDVDVRSVHTLGSPAPKGHASTAACPVHESADKKAGVTVTITASMDAETGAEADAPRADRHPSKASAILALCKDKAPCCEAGVKPAAKVDDAASRAGWAPAETAVQIPEVGRAAAAGEWLIPDGEVLIVAFGPHTVADADGKAVVREHLAVISAEVADEPASTPPPPAAGIAPALPANVEQPEAPRTAAALPELPSRTLPQGVNADGTPAPLPTLPEDEEPAAAAGDESAEPFATPQTRRKGGKPAEPPAPDPSAAAPKPEAEAAPEPAAPAPAPKTDRAAIKSSFRLPSIKGLQALEPLNSLVGSNVFPIPFQGAQFLVPLKALGVKLPFNQKLEFELVGRIVNDPEATDAHFVVGN